MHLIKDENGNLTMDIHIQIMAVRQDIAEAVRRETARMKRLHC